MDKLTATHRMATHRMAKRTSIDFLAICLGVAAVVGCSGSDKDTIRDLPDPAPKPGHGRTHKPIPALQEVPGATPVTPGSKDKAGSS